MLFPVVRCSLLMRSHSSSLNRTLDRALKLYPDFETGYSAEPKCPECSAPMAEASYENSDVLVRVCTGCRGIWMDQDQIKQIMHHLEHEIISMSLTDMERKAWHQFIELFTGKKGVVCEFKDFLAAYRMISIRFSVDHPKIVKAIDEVNRNTPFK